MRENWTYKKLGEVCEIEYGTRVVQARDGGSIYPVYGGGGATFMMDTYNRENRVVVSRFAMSKKCTRKVIGKFFLNDSGLTIKSKEPLLLQNYLDTFILSSNDKIYHLGRGLAQKNLKVPDLLQIDIAIPNAEVQQSIVAELDKINELISLKKAQLSDLDALAQSIFYDMFGDPIENEKGWEVKKLGEVGVEKLSYGSGASAIEYDGETRYVRITDITDGGELDTNVVSPNVIENKYLLNDGDILFARSGATVGKTFLYTPKYGRCIYAGYLIRYIPDKKVVLPLYVFALTKTNYYKSFISSSQRAVAQPNINAKQYSDLQIPLPPLSLQQDFAKRVELIEQQKAQISSTIKDLDTLLASRMQYWFD